MGNAFETSFKYKLIYIFEIRDETHKGLLKIGDATIDTQESIDKLPPNCKALNSAAMARIKQYTNTAGVDPKLLHTELAIKTTKNSNGSIETKAFRDFEVHRVLENSGIKKKNLSGSTSREWFKTDLQTAKKARLFDLYSHDLSVTSTELVTNEFEFFASMRNNILFRAIFKQINIPFNGFKLTETVAGYHLFVVIILDSLCFNLNIGNKITRNAWKFLWTK